MRRIFQIDGVDSGLLSVGESKLVDRVVLCIQSGDQEAHLMLNRETFKQLCGLEYQLKFVWEPEPQESETEKQQLQVV